ncbi:lantibiotic dehydratase [Actinoplanes aureus]|uniref:Lantibiotic dehydratase n=1 Tax=Actinoplanes aureus TaxID=2792083 RepID=A0A931CF21_9ACTN|nr:lantibiotic dehydratase [Actinoplanes aureus]MBG0566018.1 lantibiotic dehydratase [Actinoplanes aureus]
MAAGIEILEWAVLRAAGWPIEITDRFAAPEVAEAAGRLLAVERRIAGRRETTLARLHRAVPVVTGNAARRWLLGVRRLVHQGDDPLPETPAGVAADLALVPGLTALIAQERAERAEAAARYADLATAHRAELARQREALAALTAEARFGRALALANPVVARSWARRAEPPVRARDLRLEATVFRYLMRSAGRATPQGAWAGVAALAPAAGAAAEWRMTPATRRYRAHVDLAPFAAAAAHLAWLPRYRQDYPLQINPTLHAAGDAFRYEREHRTDRPEWTDLPANPLFQVLIEVFRDGEPRLATPLIDTLVSASPEPDRLRPVLAEAVRQLLDRDVLRSALRFPPAPADPEAAIREFADRLVEPDRSLWTAVANEVSRCCADLADDFDDHSPEAVAALVARIGGEIGRLGGPPDPPFVHLDMALPVSAAWTPSLRRAVRDAAREVLGFVAAEGLAEEFRSAAAGRLTRAMPAGDGLPLTELFYAYGRQLGDDRSGIEEWVESRATRRRRWIRSPSRTPYLLPASAIDPAPRPGPAGTLLFTVGGSRLVFQFGRPQPALFAARVAALLEDGRGGVITNLRELFRGWARHGTRTVEVIGADPANRNAAVRPRIADLDLCAHSPDCLEFGVRLTGDRAWLSSATGPLMPVYGSAALIGRRDVCSRVLFALAMGHGWEFVSGGFPIDGRDHLPAVLLPGGTVLSPEQWAVDAPTVQRLAAAEGAAQYLEWRREAERLALPGLVWLRRAGSGDHPILLRTDSPLAVSCVFRARHGGVVLTALPGDRRDWPVRDPQGRHYLAELAITWHDGDHGNSTPRGGHDLDPGQRRALPRDR